MELAIEIARKSRPEDGRPHPRVGAVLASADGTVIETAARGEDGPGQHAEFSLLRKLGARNVNVEGAELFVTLEPCTARGHGKVPCAERIRTSGVQRIHIGMLDPNPHILGRGETSLRWAGLQVERFPDELVRQLEELNSEFVAQHRRAHLPSSSLYVTTQISDIILSELQAEGLRVHEVPHDWDLTIDDLVHSCRGGHDPASRWDLSELVRQARRKAFDRKYAAYTYERDVRGRSHAWRSHLLEILSRLGVQTLRGLRVLDVGISNGLEGEGLLEDIEELTIVDVASTSLDSARKRLPRARPFQADAEDLRPINAGSHDVYLSMRTYQSSYLDMTRATREAYRVLRPGGLFVASIANGFMGDDDELIPGLVLPRTSIVDRDRPFELVERVRRQLSRLRFADIGVLSSEGEIFVFGRRTL